MGIRFRKSKKIGPLRINVSKSGVGYSFGSKFLRFTKKSNGGTRYTSTIPGTGVSFINETKGGKKMKKNKKNKKMNLKKIGIGILVFFALGAVFSDPDKEEATLTENQQEVVERVILSELPSVEESELPSAEETETPSAEKTETPSAEKTETPSAEKTETPSAEKTETPSAEKTETKIIDAPKEESGRSLDAAEKQETQETVVYITETGKRYHSNPNCGNGNYFESTLSHAEKSGLTPCSKCY